MGGEAARHAGRKPARATGSDATGTGRHRPPRRARCGLLPPARPSGPVRPWALCSQCPQALPALLPLPGGGPWRPRFLLLLRGPRCGVHNTQVSPPPRVSSLSARVVFTRVASWSARCSVKEMCDSPVSPGAGEGRGGPGVRPTRTGSGGRGECVSVMAQCWVTGRRPLWLGPWVLPDVARRASCGPFFWKIGSSGSWV